MRLSGRILLAEDGPDNQALLSAYLRKAGAEVVVADNGKIACQVVSDAIEDPADPGFDLILMDMQMPELDGYGATAKLRGMGYRGPIVALTANAMATDRNRCLHVGCTDYLSKPIRRDDLLEAARSYLAPAATASGPEDPDVADDEILARHRPAFVGRLPGFVGQLLDSIESDDFDRLGRVAHQLAGTAGIFGCADVSAAAVLLDETLKQTHDRDALQTLVNSLVQTIRVVDGYELSRESG